MHTDEAGKASILVELAKQIAAEYDASIKALKRKVEKLLAVPQHDTVVKYLENLLAAPTAPTAVDIPFSSMTFPNKWLKLSEGPGSCQPSNCHSSSSDGLPWPMVLPWSRLRNLRRGGLCRLQEGKMRQTAAVQRQEGQAAAASPYKAQLLAPNSNGCSKARVAFTAQEPYQGEGRSRRHFREVDTTPGWHSRGMLHLSQATSRRTQSSLRLVKDLRGRQPWLRELCFFATICFAEFCF